MKRRSFLILSASGAIAGTVAGRGFTERDRSLVYGKDRIYRSANGLLELDLNAGEGSIVIGGKTVYPLTYNGQMPGPRLEVKAGDRIRIHFTNALNAPTNLHFHGLHVTPEGNGDNPFLHVHPGDRLTYDFTLPQNHRSGTYWYHPHQHHRAADQVFGGLAGLFIVRGDLDEIEEIEPASEEFLILKDFAFDNRGRIRDPRHHDVMMGREGEILTVNGQINPTFSIARGGLLRLRVVNASASRFYRLSLEDHPFYLIATDGGAIESPIELSDLLLAPGERAEVLVRGDREPASYRLLTLPYDRGGMGMGMMTRGRKEGPRVLATLIYRGSVTTLSLPEKLLPVEKLPRPTAVRSIEMSMLMGPPSGMAFAFNGEVYAEGRIDSEVRLNSIEDWELINRDRFDHPFHLHTNPFQIVSRDGHPEPYRAWKDTVLVRRGETVRIRVPFRDFTGKTVYHCHINDHEDLGMMGSIVLSQ